MKLKIGFSLFVLLLFTVAVNAQDLPCDGTDVDASCPLDTWVMILMAAFSVFAAYVLLRRKKSLAVATVR
jgi:membrane protease YdiL (CAAX protease family)